jgi:hypothetical protein
MNRSWLWLPILLLGVLAGTLGTGARPEPTAAPEHAELRRLIRREEQLLSAARAASNAAPNDFRAASAYTVRLLRTLEQRALLESRPGPSPAERELPQALQRCEAAASNPDEQEVAEGLRIRTSALFRAGAPSAPVGAGAR